MASQAGSYAALLAGGVAVVAGFTGHSVRDVIAGRSSPLKGLVTEPPPPQSGGGSVPAAYLMPGKVSAPKGIPKTRREAGFLKGVGSFEGERVALWIVPFLKYARAHGWKGTVTSGYRSTAEQAAIYNSGTRPAARPGTSNHEGKRFPRGAVDVTNAEELNRILQSLPFGSLLKWAGAQDPVHFSFPHGGSY